MKKQTMRLNKNLKNGILTAYKYHLENTWVNCDIAELIISQNTLKFAYKNINEFQGDEDYKNKLREIAAEALYVINELLMCWDYEKEEKENHQQNESKEKEKIVFRYVKIDAEKIEESERKRKQHFIDLEAAKNNNKLLSEELCSLKNKQSELNAELIMVRSQKLSIGKRLEAIQSAFKGIEL